MSDANRVHPAEIVACLAWPGILFAVGWAAVAGLDFLLRSRDGDLLSGGFPRDVWFHAHTVLAAIAVFAAWTSWRRFAPGWRAGLIVLALSLGFPVYVLACIAYGIRLGGTAL